MEEKKALRKQIRQIFQDLSPEELETKSRELSRRLKSFLLEKLPATFSLSNDFIFGAYAPMSDEAQWHLELLSSFQGRTAFPAMGGGENGDGMHFFRCDFEALELRTDFFFPILCPPRDCSQVEPSALLIPGRAFSRQGERLGRGKAYYDNYLKNYQGIKIGICLEMQLCEVIPVNAHDQNVDYIVTEKQIIDTSKQHKSRRNTE